MILFGKRLKMLLRQNNDMIVALTTLVERNGGAIRIPLSEIKELGAKATPRSALSVRHEKGDLFLVLIEADPQGREA